MGDGKKLLKVNAEPWIFSEVLNPRKKPVKRKAPFRRGSAHKQLKPSINDQQVKLEGSGIISSIGAVAKSDVASVLHGIKPNEEHTQSTSSSPRNANEAAPLLRMKMQIKSLRLRLAHSEKRQRMLERNLSTIFTPDQLEALGTQRSKVTKWSDNTIKKGLQMRFCMGTHAYNSFRNDGMPLPSIRTLYERVQGIKFAPGLQHDVVEALREKVWGLKQRDRVVALLLDEIQLREAVEYDPSLCKLTGYVTLPITSQEKTATHALVTMIRGVSSPWKQVLSWHLTGSSIPGKELQGHVFEIINAVECAGIHVIALVSDMGSNNIALWNSMGIKISKNAMQHFVPHPARQNSKLYVVADPPHLLKCIRNNLLKYDFDVHGCSFSSTDVVPLPSDGVECYAGAEPKPGPVVGDQVISSGLKHTVKMQYLVQIVNHQEFSDLRLAHKLKQKHIRPDRHQKMNVGLACQLLSEDTAAAVQTFASLGVLPPDAMATAVFLRLISNWFSIVSSRRKREGLVRGWRNDFSKKKSLVLEVNNVMKTLRAGKKWLPFQSGTIASSMSLFAIEEELKNLGFKFVLGGRFSQDALENVFSLIRSRSDCYPTAKKFRANLRNICISQYLSVISSGSYPNDCDAFFATLIKSSSLKTDNCSTSDDNADRSFVAEIDESVNVHGEVVANALNHLAGYVIFKTKDKLCGKCSLAVSSPSASSTADSLYTNYLNKGGLTIPSRQIVEILHKADTFFVERVKLLPSMVNPVGKLSCDFQLLVADMDFPALCLCCLKFVLNRFFKVRLYIHSEAVTRNLKRI